MKISIIGAGPAGLYFAILMKRIDSSHKIEVVERNPPDATFGWGVVFSEETLGELRDADYESYVEITDTFASWDAIDVHYRGSLLRSRGHSFSAISRKGLLGLLQRRAAELGVKLRFEEEVEDLERFRRADLIVGADGANSFVRSLHPDAFGYSGNVYPSKFAWFGTNLVFDAFTFIFRETEYGIFQAHAYPFDASLSTFIVECNEDVWASAGLDKLDEEESIAFCQELFAPELGKHRLLSNRSLWTSFVQVNCESWRSENIVLLGDAAHTAHFTIGSGTKLAMEDSVALANAFVRHPDVSRALVEYELERQPAVERFQDAARESATYFERVKDHHHYSPMQFAFNLLTRSGRIGYANMSMRDPAFVRTLDSWFAGSANGGETVGIAAPPTFAPLRMGEKSFANRVVLAPPGEGGSPDGMPGPAQAKRLSRAAEAGVGLVLTEPVAIAADARITSECPTIESDQHAEAWRRMAEDLRGSGRGLIGIQLNHAGRRGSTRPRRLGVDIPLADGGWPLISASPIPYLKGSPTPREMDTDDMERVVREFEAAAERAAIGFDLLELNLAHGYLLGSFLSPLTNEREDEFGGELDRRLVFPLRVVQAVRDAWPAERPLSACISATDWSRRGTGVDDAVRIARGLAEAGCGLIHVAAGQTIAGGAPEYRRSYLTALAHRIRSQAGVPTLVGGYMTTVDEVNTAVGSGRADLCLLEIEALSAGPAVAEGHS